MRLLNYLSRLYGHGKTPDLDWRGFVLAFLYLVAGVGFGQKRTKPALQKVV